MVTLFTESISERLTTQVIKWIRGKILIYGKIHFLSLPNNSLNGFCNCRYIYLPKHDSTMSSARRAFIILITYNLSPYWISRALTYRSTRGKAFSVQTHRQALTNYSRRNNKHPCLGKATRSFTLNYFHFGNLKILNVLVWQLLRRK